MDAHPKTSKVVVCELSDGNKIEYPSARKAAKNTWGVIINYYKQM